MYTRTYTYIYIYIYIYSHTHICHLLLPDLGLLLLLPELEVVPDPVDESNHVV